MQTKDDWTHLTLADAGAEIGVFEKPGTPALAPLVLLHGAGGNALTWLPMEAAFANRRTILVDMPGHGSSRRPSNWELESLATTIGRLVGVRLDHAPAIWGGHSWGGKVAGLVAASNAARCSGLLLVDPSPSAALPVDIDGFVDGIWTVEMGRYASPDEAAAAARGLEHWQPWSETTARAFRHGLARRDDGSWSLRPDREDLLALATAALHGDFSEKLANNAGVPTLLLVAEESSAWQGITNMAVYAHATQAVIPGHHWIHLCSRDAVARAATSWLDGFGA